MTTCILTNTNRAAVFICRLIGRARVQMAAPTVGSGRSRCSLGAHLFAPLFRSCSIASQTFSVRLALTRESVFRGQFVPVNAMRLFSMLRGHPDASQNVDTGSYVLYVDRVNTQRSTAQMVAVAVWPKNVNKHSEGNSVGVMIAAPELNSSIAVGLASCPQPTRRSVKSYIGINFDLREKAGEKFSAYGKSIRIRIGHELKFLFSLCQGSAEAFGASLPIRILPRQTPNLEVINLWAAD